VPQDGETGEEGGAMARLVLEGSTCWGAWLHIVVSFFEIHGRSTGLVEQALPGPRLWGWRALDVGWLHYVGVQVV